MPIIAYLANHFPSPVEPYVFEEIRELRRRGIDVIPCSARRPHDAGPPMMLPLTGLALRKLRRNIH